MSEKELETRETVPLTTKEAEAGVPPAYTQQPPTATVMIAPHVAPATVTSGPPPDDYLIMSILTILFCFWPIGIIALIKSIEVRDALAKGDYARAQSASRSALTFNKVAILIGVISLVIGLVIAGLCQLAWIIPLATRRY